MGNRLQRMKTALKIAAVSLTVFVGQPRVLADEALPIDESAPMVDLVLKRLKGAQTIVVCNFKPPGGTVVAKVMKGDPMLVGKLWNSEAFPPKPVLAYEHISDDLGDGSAVLVKSGFFEIDQSKNYVVLDSIIPGENRNKRVLIPLSKIEMALTRMKAVQQCGAGDPAPAPKPKPEDKPELKMEPRLP